MPVTPITQGYKRPKPVDPFKQQRKMEKIEFKMQ